uniref:Uncharacterized protein n=1 Tax=Arundo donax TaxID=35708 RepID=A0A0A9FUD5_ARUDO
MRHPHLACTGLGPGRWAAQSRPLNRLKGGHPTNYNLWEQVSGS